MKGLKTQKPVNQMIYRLMHSFARVLVGARGFEPPTPWSQTRCANRAALRPENQERKYSTL